MFSLRILPWTGVGVPHGCPDSATSCMVASGIGKFRFGVVERPERLKSELWEKTALEQRHAFFARHACSSPGFDPTPRQLRQSQGCRNSFRLTSALSTAFHIYIHLYIHR